MKADIIEQSIRTLLVDDQTVIRQGLSSFLGRHPDIEIVGEAGDGEAAIRLARLLKPDVILMDISMPKMNGLDATRVIHSELPKIRIIGLSMHEEADIADALLDAGASDYLCKSGDCGAILSAVRRSAPSPFPD